LLLLSYNLVKNYKHEALKIKMSTYILN